jgi:PAS domain S-box-containing protein
MHVGKVGQVAAERHPILVKDIACEDSWIVRPEWAKREGIRSFAGYPLVFQDNLLGVIAVFSRRPLGDQEFAWLGLFANYAAVAIANTRAFEDLKGVEEALRASERNLILTINTIPTFISVSRADGTVLSVNQAALDYHGVTLQDVQRGDHRTRFFHPDDVERVREVCKEALKLPRPFQYELRAMGKDGKYRWFSVRHNPLLDDQGRIERWYAIAFDIEDRKRAEAEVEQAYARLAQAQRLSKTGSFITDLLADEHNWSEELCRIFEFDPGTPVTIDAIRAAFHPEDLPVYEDAFKRAIDGLDREIDITYRIITPAGNVKHLHAVTHIMDGVAGRPVYIGAVQDVTERKTAEEALTRARSELAHMARVTTLSALTASIAHDVNQPIAAAVTSAGACLRWLNRDHPDVQRAREAAMRIEDDGKRAAEIISHVRSFYKKEALPQRELVPVNDLVDEMLVLLRSEADRHSVVMRTDLTADLPSVSADRVQLQQVLMNLMLNGMEAMSERGGELKISTRREGDEVMVSVRDTGVGIPTDKMEQIFNAFVTTKAGGTGMGLAISRTIIESHGGRLWATVNPEQGATFRFTLPTDTEV